MNPLLSIIGLSIVVQAIASVAVLRLQFIYGHRWAWALISTAIVLMTVRDSPVKW